MITPAAQSNAKLLEVKRNYFHLTGAKDILEPKDLTEDQVERESIC